MSNFINSNRTIAYESYGGGSKTLLLIHDLGGCGKDFERLVTDLSARGRVITIDLCGHGESSVPREVVSLKTMARDIVALIRDKYIGRSSVVGLGVGGAVMLEAFLLAPELFEDYVFIDTFTSKIGRSVFQENLRPVSNIEKDKKFRDTFKRWVSVYRDDLFIFANEFDASGILRLCSNRMLFIYGDRFKEININKSLMELPEYSNLYIYIVENAGRWLLESHYERIKRVITRFLIDGNNDVDAEGDNIGGDGGSTDETMVDINNLMYLN